MRLHVQYRGIAFCIPGKGDTVSFWDDLFYGTVHSLKYPHLFGFAKETRISLQKVRSSESLLDCFRIPMTRDAYNEFLDLQEELTLMQPNNSDENDSWHFTWGNQSFSSNRHYHHQYASLRPQLYLIWKAKCVPKIKFFSWLLLNDRLNTRNMLRRKKFLEEGYCCVLCQDFIEETREHLFFDCSTAITRWFALGIIWEEGLNIHDRLAVAKRDFPHPFFMEVFMIGSWCIWNERNALNFDGKAPNFNSWNTAFKKEITAHLFKIKQSLHHSVRVWLNAL